MPEKKIPFAVAYDFDGTLTPHNMQEYEFIPALGLKPKKFWEEVKVLAARTTADEILAYMFQMLKMADQHDIPVRRDDFRRFGGKIEFFPGVLDWFSRVNAYGRTRGVETGHYVISSGLKEMIEGTPIAGEFKQIYASSFMYDANEVAVWAAQAVNYTNKTQYLFRINKGAHDLSDKTTVNAYVTPEKRPVPFTNMVFIGDGETDIPCMRLVREQKGHSVAVYPHGDEKKKRISHQLIEEDRVHASLEADYSPGSPLEKFIFALIDKISADEKLRSAITP